MVYLHCKFFSCLKVGILLPAFLFLPVKLFAQQYALKNFSVTDGLPQSQVYGLHQDNDGFIWMGTKGGGLVKFDGNKFEPLFQDNKRLLFVNKITSKSDNVFIATTNGFAVYNTINKKLHFPDNAVNNTNQPVSFILPITKDSILVATTSGVYLGPYTKLKKIAFDVREDDEVVSCGILYGNSIYMGNNYGVTALTKTNNNISIESYGRKNGLKVTAVRCFTDWENTLLVGTYGGGIFKFSNSRFTPYEIKTMTNDEVVQCFLNDNTNSLWIGTAAHGVYVLNKNENTLQNITEDEGLCRNNIVSLLEDDWGNIWLGSSGGGISRYNGQVFVHYNNRTGLPGKNVYACIQTPDTAIWLGSSAPGLTCIKEQIISQYNAQNGFTDAKVKFLHYSLHHNKLFIGTEGDGLWTFENNVFSRMDDANEHTGRWIKHIYEDATHRLFISTASKGVICLDENLALSFKLNKTNHLPNNRINASVFHNGYLWIATEGDGLVYYNEKTHATKTYTLKNKLPSNIIRCVEKDAYNHIWCGTPAGAGYFNPTLREPAFVRTPLPEGHHNIYLILAYQQHIYFGTAKGIVKKKIDADKIGSATTFTANEGFLGIECSQNAVSTGINNTVFFGTINGLSIFQPSFERFNNLSPKLSFIQINLFYENLLHKEKENLNGLVFNYQQNHLGFKFIGINQLNPEGVKYQWKLKGLEENWSPLTKTNEVNYTNLLPGSYTFLVKACNENGIWTKKPLAFSFEITKPWFKQNWFYATLFIFILTVLIGTYYLLTNNNRKKQERVQQRLLLENKLLEIQQMALRLQMNPHFIFNCLNSIQNLVSQNQNEGANFYIQKFSGLMRGMVDLTPKETIALDQEINLLKNYLKLEQLNRNNSFDYRIETKLEDSADFYRIPPLLLQPFAENAIVHGFKGIDRKGEIIFLIEEKNNGLVISILDNGKGVESTVQLPDERNSAIKITTERLNLFNKQKGNWIHIQKREKGEHGLKVTLELKF